MGMLVYPRGSVRHSRRHSALQFGLFFTAFFFLFHLVFTIYLNIQSQEGNGPSVPLVGYPLLLVATDLLTSFGIVLCFAGASLWISEIEWAAMMLGLVGAFLAMLINQIGITFAIVYVSLKEDYPLRALYCQVKRVAVTDGSVEQIEGPLCPALRINVVASLLLLLGCTITWVFAWLRLREILAHQTVAFERQHNVPSGTFRLMNFFNFLSLAGLIIDTAGDMRLAVQGSTASFLVSSPIGSSYLLALSLGVAFCVGSGRGQFRFCLAAGFMTCATYSSTFIYNVRSLHEDSYGALCLDSKTDCSILTSTVVAQGIVVFSQFFVGMIGFWNYSVKLYPAADHDAFLGSDDTVTSQDHHAIGSGHGSFSPSRFSSTLPAPITSVSFSPQSTSPTDVQRLKVRPNSLALVVDS